MRAALCGWVLVTLLGAGMARGQEQEVIVGWGWQVVVPPSALTDLVVVAA